MDAGKNGPLENDGDANAICRHEIMKAQSNINDFLSVGDDVYHRWTCSKDYDVTKYQLMIRKCVATSRSRDSVNIIDGNGCIVDDLLMQSLKYNQEKLDAVAESKIFKFIDEPELRFGCNVVLIEKNNSTVELPKCSISTTEIRERIRKGTKSAQPYFEHGDQLYRDFSTSLSNLKYIETTTLTEWLIIKDNVEISNKNNKSDFEILASIDTALDNGAIFTEKLTIQDELQSFAPNQLPNLVNFGNVAQNLDKSVGSVGTTMSPPLEVGRTGVDIQTITPKFQTEETDEPDIIEEITENHEQNSMLKKIEQLLVDNSKKSSNKIDSGNFDEQSFDFNEFSNEKIQEKIIEKSDDSYENKNDWRLDDSFLNGTDETLISCVNELAKLNGTTRYFIEPSSSLVCSWRSVNIALFLWSLASLIIWLVFLTFKLHYFFWKKARKDRIIRQNVQNCHLVWSRTSDSYGFGDRYGSTLDPNHCKYLD
uniref:ZP domain-containing protein n=1 Tax=Panagrolaimus sp. JU765 TaxID=591449 RepID=A0AC34RIZ0_9BILA